LRRIQCKYPEPFLKTPKVALVQKFPLAGQDCQLLVINIHATLIRSVKATIEEMQHIISFLPHHDGPVIFAGDFNTFSSKYLTAICQELKAYGLNLVPIENDPRAKTQALDQVFVRDLKVISIKIEDTYLNSDHFPIFLTVSL
jgi:endonuclease/exonuclease/phosphatase (EEP) superfamily protein YafD